MTDTSEHQNGLHAELSALRKRVRELEKSLENEKKQRAEVQDIRESLQEKEALVQEIHHRVKNNLQIISSLISLQESCLENYDERRVFLKSRNRIRSIALVHEVLYMRGKFSHVPAGEYFLRLTDSVFSSLLEMESRITLDLEIEEIFLDMDTAILCGLVLNELITNAIQHGYPDGRGGSIRVELVWNGANAVLSVSDDGAGRGKQLCPQPDHGLGLLLVESLAAQLKGSLRFETAAETKISLEFPLGTRERIFEHCGQ